MTVCEALAETIPRLAEAGIATARLDAELLIGQVLEVSRTWLAAHPEVGLTPEQEAGLEALVVRRERREPLPYLLGRWEFLGMSLRVTPAVLIPRPETETLVEEVARRLPPGARVLDVGTGSGCIALALARLRQDVRVLGIDSSAAAVDVAVENAHATGLEERVSFEAVTFPADRAQLPGPFDAVVSNPPYIPASMATDLPPEVRDYEPRSAVVGGADGLALLEPLLRCSGGLLAAEGLLAVEVMAGQWGSVRALAERVGGWSVAEVIRDLAGIERVLVWRRAAPGR
jgi:release factor glutamine methyltransferase